MKRSIACVMVLCAIVGLLSPTIVKADTNYNSDDNVFATVEVWNYNYEWLLYGASGVDTDFEMTWNTNDFAHQVPNVSVDIMFFPTDGRFANRGDSLCVNAEVTIYSHYMGGADSSLFDSVLVYLLYEGEEDFGSSYGLAEYGGVEDIYLKFETSSVPEDVVGVMFRIYADANYMWCTDNLEHATYSEVSICAPYAYAISSVERTLIESPDEYYDEQLIWSENIFENIKILGEYIWNLPSRIWNSMKTTLGEWYASYEEWYYNLPNMFDGFFDDLKSGISEVGSNVAESFASLFDNHSGGGTFIPTEVEISTEFMPSLDGYAPTDDSDLTTVLEEIYSVDLIADFMTIVAVVGVVAFLIFG